MVTTSRRPLAHRAPGWTHVAADQSDPAWVDVVASAAEDVEVAVLLASRISTSAALGEVAAQAALELRAPLALLARLPRLRAIVYASSCTVYGAGGAAAIVEDAPLLPGTVYAAVKTIAEDLLRVFAAGRDIALASLRIAQVFGPGSPAGEIVARLCRRAAEGGPIEVSCGRAPFRDYVHEDDVAAAIVGAIAQRAAGMLNVGSGVATRIADLAARVCTVAGIAPPVVTDTSPTFSMVLDIRRARAALAWSPRHGLDDEIHRRLRGRDDDR
jgi:nucleoside-diphosphate-sugar epimerase